VLAQTADLGTKLVIGLNSDSSIQKLKGENRPIIHQQSRAILLASFSFVDAVVLFSEDTPINLISTLLPDILAKGGDYKIETIVGHKVVQENGGEVILVPFIDGFSSTTIIEKIKKA
jgi:rfaE bifunctional protein nucleotidyltransferase chain/domain